jgi:DNA-binding MarR family transcriptional regulator
MTETTDFLDNQIGKWIAMIHLTELSLFDRQLSRYGLSRATFGFLLHLYMEDGQRQDRILREVAVNKSTVTRAVSKLERLGYVKRRPDPTDGRVCRIYLQPKAGKIQKEIIGILRLHSEKMLRGFSRKREADLFGMLRRVYDNITEYRNELEKKKNGQSS